MNHAASDHDIDHEGLARRLDRALESLAPIPPLSQAFGLTSIEDAYRVQTAWDAIRRAKGESIMGRKIGLTSQAVRDQFGVDEPDFGNLWSSRHVVLRDGRASVDTATFLQPRIEAEFAFLMGGSLPPGEVTAADVIAVTEAVAPAFEIVDSRIADWRISITDTIADNASFGAFAVSDWRSGMQADELDQVQLAVRHNGSIAAKGLGAAAMGHPANAVTWLANRLRAFGVELEPGDVVMSGSVAPMVSVASGDEFALEVDGRAVVELSFV